MDVYPQIAVSLGVVKAGVVSRAVAAGMRAGYQGCDLVVALDQDMAKEIARLSGKKVELLAPWPPEVRSVGEAKVAKALASRRWVYSGNLGRAHEFRTLLETQRLLEARGCDWELHFQGGGPVRGEAEALAAQLGLQRCRWTGYVEEEDLVPSLMAADVLIATQRPETRGLLWPSKLALMRHVGVPLVWVGPTEGAIAEWLRAQVTAKKFLVEPGESEALANWLEALPKGAASAVPLRAVQENVMAERQAGCDWWQARLTSV
jgi:glycosyltransferase involved in cell wall biosynthesis